MHYSLYPYVVCYLHYGIDGMHQVRWGLCWSIYKLHLPYSWGLKMVDTLLETLGFTSLQALVGEKLIFLSPCGWNYWCMHIFVASKSSFEKINDFTSVHFVFDPVCVDGYVTEMIHILIFYKFFDPWMKWAILILSHRRPGGWINIKMTSYQYRKSHCVGKTINKVNSI